MQPARGLRDGGAQRWALVGISYENFTDLVITGARWTRCWSGEGLRELVMVVVTVPSGRPVRRRPLRYSTAPTWRPLRGSLGVRW